MNKYLALVVVHYNGGETTTQFITTDSEESVIEEMTQYLDQYVGRESYDYVEVQGLYENKLFSQEITWH